jgi:hypothetical protein
MLFPGNDDLRLTPAIALSPAGVTQRGPAIAVPPGRRFNGMFRFTNLSNQPVRHAMSYRRTDLPAEGDIAYSRDTDPADTRANRAAFLTGAGFEQSSLTLGRQVHGTGIAVVRATDRGRGQPPAFDALPDTDGLITCDKSVALGIIVADCVPLILYDPLQHALAVVHAGWRGTVGGIAARAVERMAVEFGSKPADLLAGIGPSIGPCCYEVGDEVIDLWRASGSADWSRAVVEREPRRRLDLWLANRLILEQAGVPKRGIETAALCTRCEAGRFFSHRAALAGERRRGRMIMAAQLDDGAAGAPLTERTTGST